MLIDQWKDQCRSILSQFKDTANLKKGSLLVIGCSTSEIAGKRIGTAGTDDVAEMLYGQLDELAKTAGIELAFQCCEHLNRALVIERKTAEKRGYEEVSVVPARTAGGAMASYAYRAMVDPVVVEFIKADAGIDIGDTFIGMHLKNVAVPVRVTEKSIGSAHVTLAKVRPKLIGGERALYERTQENESCR
ncbi:TIGR01440 family protein [Bacillus massilinigeriensis]|uniref:TIGR01440 family protein n=1 Tax=Bacillus mediterraneensis TaxID=1805474 RepID=UPI0008F87E52|nr:TIGR01440 family protein [Bacillus mediterraneensis]